MVTELKNLSSATLSTSLEDAQASGFTPFDSMGSSYGFESINPSTFSSSVQALAAGPNLEIITPNIDVETSLVQNRMVFSTVNEEVRAPKPLILSNTGNAPLTITLTKGDSQEKVNAVRAADHERADDFEILNAPTGQAFTLGAGAKTTLMVRFKPKRNSSVSNTSTHLLNGENYASLTITSNDPDQQTTKVNLAGVNFAAYESVREPSVAEMARIFGFGLDVGTESLILGGAKALVGDEVYSPYWLEADPSQDVELWPLAVTSSRTDEPHAQLSFRAKPGSGGNSRTLYQFAGRLDDDSRTTGNEVLGSNNMSGGENQKLLPKILVNGANTEPTTNAVSFNPTSAFSLVVSGSSTDDSKNSSEQTHNWRMFPVRDAEGIVIPHTWFATQDKGNTTGGFKNFDFNDQVYLLKNAMPELVARDPSIGGLVPGSPNLIFNFNKTYPSTTLKDRDGQTIGLTSVQLNKDDGYTSTASYKPALLDINPTAGTLKVTTTAGINSSDNTLVNGLQTTFDGRAGRAMITTKLLGSLNYLDAGFEQVGVMFGSNDDNYIKLVVRHLPTGGVGLEFYKEIKGVGNRMGEFVPIPNAGSLQSLELMLLTDPQTGTVRAAYRVGGSAVVQLPGLVKLEGAEYGRFLAAQSKAGIITSSKGGTSFTATFDQFAVFSNETTPPQKVVHRLDVGGSNYQEGPLSDNPGRLWSSDTGFFTPSKAPSETGAGSQADILNTDNERLYRTYRALLPGVAPTAENRVLAYNLPVSSASGTYHVRLHFAEIFFGVPGGKLDGGVGSRVFDVAVENERTIRNFDITAAAGDSMTAVVLPFENVRVNDGILNIRLKADINFGAISGIEVLQKA